MMTEREFKKKLLQWNRAFRKLSVGRDELNNFRGGVGKWLLLMTKAARAVNGITDEKIEQDIQELYAKGIIYRDKCRIGEQVVFCVDYPAVRQEYAMLREGRLDEFLAQNGVFERNKTLKSAVLAMKYFHPLYWCICINKWDDKQLKEAGVDRVDESALKMYEYVFFELQSKVWVKVEENLSGKEKSLQYLIKKYYDAIMDRCFFITGEYGTGSTEEDFDRYANKMWETYQKVSDRE